VVRDDFLFRIEQQTLKTGFKPIVDERKSIPAIALIV